MQNSLSVVEDSQGTEVHEESDIVSVIANYYQDIFSTKSVGDFSLIHSLLPCKVTADMNDYLIKLPSPQEIKEAAFSINSGKAPGPDGFSSKFYQAYWHIVGEDVTRDVRKFFETGVLDRQQNETHIRLIPKGSCPRQVADYRPIALCNTYYKIIAKVLTRSSYRNHSQPSFQVEPLRIIFSLPMRLSTSSGHRKLRSTALWL